MVSKSFKYKDFLGNEREETCLFNLSESELADLHLSTVGGLDSMLSKIIQTDDTPQIAAVFKQIILKSYGEVSADGRRFIKTGPNGEPLSTAFSETIVFDMLYMELLRDPKEAADFINNIIPPEMAKAAKEIETKNPVAIEARNAAIIEMKTNN